MSGEALTHRVVVDWIELEIQLSRQSNFWTVQDVVRASLKLPQGTVPFMKALDSGSGNAASAFRFRMQNLAQLGQLTLVAATLDDRFGLEAIRPTGVEIAFDTYKVGGSVRQLAELAADRFRFITAPPGDDWYFYRKQGEGRRYVNTMPQRRDLIELFEASWQLTDRNSQEVEARYHAYVKTQDNGKALLPNRYCARLEVTLRGAALPFRSIEELAVFNFTKVSQHFNFRRIGDDVHPAARHSLTVWSGRQHGRKGRYRRVDPRRIGRYSGTSVFRGSTVADDQLNATVYECLRKLTRGWRSKRCSADFPEAFDS
jgi:hypothetical protein